jgi:formylglycine-generating enzyme required for sulfatase activity
LTAISFSGLRIHERVTERQNETHAAGLVRAVLNSDTTQTLAIIESFDKYRRWTDPLLREELGRAGPNSPQRLHASLALLPVDPSQVDYLYGRLLDADPREVPVIRNALTPHKDALLDRLWSTVEKPENGKESQRLRAAAALAVYDPRSEKWSKSRHAVADDIAITSAVHLWDWLESFRPVCQTLATPLGEIFRDTSRRETERNQVAGILADYTADRPTEFANLLMDADDQQFGLIFARFKEQVEKLGGGQLALLALKKEIDSKPTPDALDIIKEKLARRQANAVVALIKLNEPIDVWSSLKLGPDPRPRSYLIHQLHRLGVDPQAIINSLNSEQDLTVRRALLLSLGGFDEKALPSAKRTELLPTLQKMYRTETDPGLHSSVEWLLRKWEKTPWLKEVNDLWGKDLEWRNNRQEEIRHALTRGQERAAPQWYVNSQGQTMVVIPAPGVFQTGAPTGEDGRLDDEERATVTIKHTFAIAATPVTIAQFLQFKEKTNMPEAPAKPYPTLSPSLDCPMNGTTWFVAAYYCNWLSEQEGMKPDDFCYEPNSSGRYEAGMRIKKNYRDLKGYRLPDEVEWEFACRAGTITSRYFGETDSLLIEYAWYQHPQTKARMWPVGQTKPNELGLFDMLGNVWQWCQDKRTDDNQNNGHPKSSVNPLVAGLDLELKRNDFRMQRGGCYTTTPKGVRCAARSSNLPTESNTRMGFRVVKSLP